MGSLFRGFFDVEHIFTPVAIESIRFNDLNRIYRIVYIFGIRVMVINVSK